MPALAKEFSSEVLSYVAGIVDGEGCLQIREQLVQRKYKHICMDVEVCNTSKRLIDFLHDTFGGHRYTGKRPNRKIYYRWKVSSAQAEAFLRLIYPYLLIKKEQADICFALRKSMGQMGHKLSPQVVAFRRSCYDNLRALKREGYA